MMSTYQPSFETARSRPAAAAPMIAAAMLVGLSACGSSSAPGGGNLATQQGSATIPADALVIDSLADATDSDPGDGVCATTQDACTLRAAIMEANASGTNAAGDAYTIVLPAGHYVLTIANPASTSQGGVDAVPDRPLTSLDSAGSLLLSVPMTIQGIGARDVVVDANRLDRAFEIGRGADNSVLSDMTITGGFGNTLGGGVYAQAPVRIERANITGNQASGGGGIFINPTGELILSESTVSHNVSANQAGGIRIDSSGVITNSTISHNRANGPVSPAPAGAGPAPLLGKGGGLDVRGDDVTVINSTIVYNSSDAGGAGIHFAYAYTDAPPDAVGNLLPGSLGQVRLLNTIVAMNESLSDDSDCLAEVASSELVSMGGNLDSDGSCLSMSMQPDIASQDPQLLPLADNGGPTDTHALAAGSPAIGAGVAMQCAAIDQRGSPRPADVACDSGAFESPRP